MLIRPYHSTDSEAVNALFLAQHLPYDQPDWERPQFLVRAILENGTGRPEMALFLRKTAETYLLFDPHTPKHGTIRKILAMTQACIPTAKRTGLTDCHAWIAPEIEKDFGNLLSRLGWKREAWASYSRRIE